MIHTNELMLGNYVVCRVGGKDSDRRSIPMYVVGIYEDTVLLNFDGNEGDVWEEKDENLFGIDVTPKTLEDLGFKFIRTSETHRFFGIDWFGLSVDEIDRIYLNGNRLYYLHQLQNAYHLLTGKHLEIKL